MSHSPFALQAVILALAWFFAVNLAATVIAIPIGRRFASGGDASPGVWFGLRMLPAVSALLFVVTVFIPSYWRFEPRETVEAVDATLTIFALSAAAIVAAAMYRGFAVWLAAAGRTRAWMHSAQPIVLPGTTMEAFEIDAEMPILALAGILRPRLLVTRGLLAALTPDELAASVAHELGHSHARDNLKRLMMRSAPDLFGFTATARTIERRWAAASEHRADRIDEHEPAARCALAAALVKVARLTPVTPSLGEPISTLIGGGDIASRVRNLLDDRAPAKAATKTGVVFVTLSGTLLAMVVVYAPALRVVHEATEALVRGLP
jgi:Zn-dependent protease with chaperone function